MKKISTLLLMLAGTGTLFAQNGPELMHYRFNGSGISVPNEASAPPAGTATAAIMGGLTQGAGGQCGGALTGTGNSSSSDYLNTNWAPNLSSSWTISMYTKDITPSATLFYMFGDINAGELRCFTNGVAGANNWILRGPFADVTVYGGATVAPHITTFVYDAMTSDIRGYLDGVLVNTVPQSGIFIGGTGPFKVGGYSTNVGLPAGGKLDEFRFYSRALTAAEVAQLSIVYHTSAAVTACNSFTAPGSSVAWTTSGSYTDTLISTALCDSIVDYTLTIKNSSTGTMTATACDSFAAPDGTVFYTGGIQSVVLPNAAGCDSVITLNLTITNSSAGSITLSTCDSIIAPDGATYNTSGTYVAHIANTAGCDSTITINLTVNSPTTSTLTTVGCGMYAAPDGATYTTSGTYTALIPNVAGCDSTITINLTVVNLDATVTENFPTYTANATGVAYQWITCTGDTLTAETSQSFTATVNGDYAVIIANSGCADTSNCINVVTLGIAEATTGTASIFPNPASAGFTVQTATVANLIVVYDVLGKTIASVQPNGNTTLISMEGQENGIYFVKISSAAGTETRRLIKQ